MAHNSHGCDGGVVILVACGDECVNKQWIRSFHCCILEIVGHPWYGLYQIKWMVVTCNDQFHRSGFEATCHDAIVKPV